MNKVLRYTIEALNKSAPAVEKAANDVRGLGATIRKALGGIGQWAARELNALAESPKHFALALALATAAGRVWRNVVTAMIDRAKAAKELFADMANENLANTLARQARGYDRLKESIEGAAAAARQMSQAQGEREQAATSVAVTELQAQKMEALGGITDEGERKRVSTDFDKRIKAAELEGKAAEAAREVADAEREAAENAERRKNAEERIAQLSAQVTEESKRLVIANKKSIKAGEGAGDRILGSLATITSLGNIEKGSRIRYRNKAAADKEVERVDSRLESLSKEIEEARQDLASIDASSPVLSVAIDTAKARAKSVENEKRAADAEQASADAADTAKARAKSVKNEKRAAARRKAKADAADTAKAREEYVESVKAEADALREQEREHLRAASEYAAAAEQLSNAGAQRFAQWESVGFRDMDAWRAEEAEKKAGLDDEAKFEKALKKANDRERKLGERSLKKSDKEILAFQKKREDELKKAADEANKAEQLRQREREERKAADTVQKEIRDLLKRNLQMDGGGNGGGPE